MRLHSLPLRPRLSSGRRMVPEDDYSGIQVVHSSHRPPRPRPLATTPIPADVKRSFRNKHFHFSSTRTSRMSFDILNPQLKILVLPLSSFRSGGAHLTVRSTRDPPYIYPGVMTSHSSAMTTCFFPSAKKARLKKWLRLTRQGNLPDIIHRMAVSNLQTSSTSAI